MRDANDDTTAISAIRTLPIDRLYEGYLLHRVTTTRWSSTLKAGLDRHYETFAQFTSI